jgi:hypothetical protein
MQHSAAKHSTGCGLATRRYCQSPSCTAGSVHASHMPLHVLVLPHTFRLLYHSDRDGKQQTKHCWTHCVCCLQYFSLDTLLAECACLRRYLQPSCTRKLQPVCRRTTQHQHAQWQQHVPPAQQQHLLCHSPLPLLPLLHQQWCSAA